MKVFLNLLIHVGLGIRMNPEPWGTRMPEELYLHLHHLAHHSNVRRHHAEMQLGQRLGRLDEDGFGHMAFAGVSNQQGDFGIKGTHGERRNARIIPDSRDESQDYVCDQTRPRIRQAAGYWRKRLLNADGTPKDFEGIVYYNAYKPGTDNRLKLPWRGFVKDIIAHKHFGDVPVHVFAIRLE
jgi:hypothetical protein